MKSFTIIFVIILFILWPVNLYAQEGKKSSDIKEYPLDLLKAPTSPGFIFLDKQPTDIERPTNPTDFMVSLRHATNEFSSIPKSYAIELAPFWLFGGENISFDDLTSDENKVDHNIQQSLTLSLAIQTDDQNPANTRLGTGIKFSLIRGNVTEAFKTANQQRMEILKSIEFDFHEDVGYQKLVRKYKDMINAHPENAEVIAIQEEIDLDNYQNNRMNSLQKKYGAALTELSKTKLERTGWGLDAAAGFVTDFPGQVFDKATVPKYGAWLTLSHEGEGSFTFLAVARELFQKDEQYTDQTDSVRVANLNHTDGGLRFIWDYKKFSLSLEALGRVTSGGDNMKDENKSAWKLMLNTSYDLGDNKIITFDFGRDFDGTITKDGNLVAALNLILGFGSVRNIEPSK